jgi:AcrR family transcriptional regulator
MSNFGQMKEVQSKLINKENVRNKQMQIVKASMHIFAEKGFHATSLKDIAKASGMHAAVIYNYISTQDDTIRIR